MHAPFSANPLHIADTAQRMAQKAEGTESRVFQKVAVVSLGVVAAASAAQVLLGLLRELNRRYDNDRNSDRSR